MMIHSARRITSAITITVINLLLSSADHFFHFIPRNRVEHHCRCLQYILPATYLLYLFILFFSTFYYASSHRVCNLLLVKDYIVITIIHLKDTPVQATTRGIISINSGFIINMSEELDQVNTKNTSLSVEESMVILQETPPSVGIQEVSTEIIPPENEQQVLLTESEIKKEPISEDDPEWNDYKIYNINHELDTYPVPWSYSLLRLFETEDRENLNELPHYVPKRYSARKPKRRCLSVPRYMKLLTEPKIPTGAITMFDTDSESDNDGDSSNKLKTNLKRKRDSMVLESIIKIAAKQ